MCPGACCRIELQWKDTGSIAERNRIDMPVTGADGSDKFIAGALTLNVSCTVVHNRCIIEVINDQRSAVINIHHGAVHYQLCLWPCGQAGRKKTYREQWLQENIFHALHFIKCSGGYLSEWLLSV
jgi:hypothetical protein